MEVRSQEAADNSSAPSGSSLFYCLVTVVQTLVRTQVFFFRAPEEVVDTTLETMGGEE